MIGTKGITGWKRIALAGAAIAVATGAGVQAQSTAQPAAPAEAPAPAQAPAQAPAPAAPSAQPGQTANADTFNIPEDIVILGSASPNLRRATARVNGTIITGTDVEQRVALVLAANNATNVPEAEIKRLQMDILRNLIDETLQIQEAEALEIPVSREEVEEAYQRLASSGQFNRNGQSMEAYLASIGSSANSLKRQIEGELAWDRVMRRNIAPFINVSASEVSELYERLQASRGQQEYRLAEIYLASTPATQAQVKATADRIVEQLRQGGSFAAYARQFSQASTASVGGDLGWIRLEQLQNPQLEAIARELQPGQLVGPVEIPGGLEILYLVDRRQIGMADPRDALLSLKQISLAFAPGTSQQQAQAQAARFTEAVQAIRGCGEAESAAAAIGADVVANDQIAVRSLPDALQPLLLELNVGQVTPPFGSLEEGVRVLMLCGRDDPQATSGPSIEQLESQIEEDRVNKRAQRYLRDLRRDAVIEYN